MDTKEAYITFIVTQSCQLSCKYCYLVGKNHNNKMNIEVAKKMVDIVLSNSTFQNCQSAVFDFIGGEPLLEIDLINDVLKYLDQRLIQLQHHWTDKYSINITTNGLLYHKEEVQKLINKYNKRLTISISIDGTQQKHDLNRIYSNGKGSWKDIQDNVKLWISQYPSANTRMTISHSDLQYVFESLVYLVNLGITNIDVNPVLEDVWQEGDNVTFQKQLILFADYIIDNNLQNKLIISCFNRTLGYSYNCVEHKTPCGEHILTVDSDGNLYTCLRFAQFSLRNKPARKIGNVWTGIDKNKMRPFLSLSLRLSNPGECEKCEIATGCKYCPAENYDCSNIDSIFTRSTANCLMHQSIVEAKNYYYNKLKNNSILYARN